MKHITLVPICGILIFFTMLTFLSCRTTKQKSERLLMAHQRAQISKHSQQIQGVSILDSSNRGWFFRSDTAFYYHPDSGLYARNGILSFWEAGVKSKQWLSRQDSVYQHNAESVDTHFFSTHLQKLSQQKWIPIMGILLLLVCGYGICYIGKRFI